MSYRPLLAIVVLAFSLLGCGTTADLDSVFADYQCESDDDCSSDQRCVAGYCEATEPTQDATIDVTPVECTCGDGLECCGEVCIDLSGDIENCGACGVSCGSGEECVAGVCECGDVSSPRGAACIGGEICCNGACANPQIDPACCGSSGATCGANQLCLAGSCICDGGLASCGADPTGCETDIFGDSANCGSCGTACEVGKDCIGGRCACGGDTCGVGETCCQNSAGLFECVGADGFQTDAQHCGGCGILCPAGHDCLNGVCSCGTTGVECTTGDACCGDGASRACAAPTAPLCDCGGAPCAEECCNNACIDTTMDAGNCGGCGLACPDAAQSCQSGVCACPAGTVGCSNNTECVTTTDNPQHCGTCGNVCGPNEACCGLVCQDISSDVANCGGCGVLCAGECIDGVCELPEVPVKVVAGHSHTCSLTQDNSVFCWGRNGRGQLGLGHNNDTGTPEEIVGFSAVDIDAGREFTCAIDTVGGVWCWGRSDRGQLGPNTTLDQELPVAVPEVTGVAVSIACGYEHACAILDTGAVECWGRNDSSELGDPTASSSHGFGVPALPAPAIDLGLGRRHGCAVLDNNDVYCWGRGQSGQLGHGFENDEETPVQTLDLFDGALVDAGGHGTFALDTTGQLWGWGFSDAGRLLSGGNYEEDPQPVGTGYIDVIRAPNSFVCAVTAANGEVHCWGNGGNGQLGNGDNEDESHNNRQTVQGLVGVVHVSGGERHACALRNDATVFCWGDGLGGRLGVGFVGERDTPQEVTFP